ARPNLMNESRGEAANAPKGEKVFVLMQKIEEEDLRGTFDRGRDVRRAAHELYARSIACAPEESMDANDLREPTRVRFAGLVDGNARDRGDHRPVVLVGLVRGAARDRRRARVRQRCDIIDHEDGNVERGAVARSIEITGDAHRSRVMGGWLVQGELI